MGEKLERMRWRTDEKAEDKRGRLAHFNELTAHKRTLGVELKPSVRVLVCLIFIFMMVLFLFVYSGCTIRHRTEHTHSSCIPDVSNVRIHMHGCKLRESNVEPCLV